MQVGLFSTRIYKGDELAEEMTGNTIKKTNLKRLITSVNFEPRLTTKEVFPFGPLPFLSKRCLFMDLLVGLAGSEEVFLH